MAEDPTIKKLEARITELENQLKGFAAPEPPTAEEIQAYHKVSAHIGTVSDWGCGINECRPVTICRVCRVCVVCAVCRVCRICINECTCGPCIQGGGGGGFQGFGQ